MSDFNQPTRKQDEQVPSATPPTGQQTRQTQHGAIERNPDADGRGEKDGEANRTGAEDGPIGGPK